MQRRFFLSALAGGLIPSFATAQDETQNYGLIDDEITVTALRREQSAQDVGISLTAIDGADLRALGVETINGLETVTPGLEIESQFGSGQPSFSIRGVGFRDYATNNAPTVGIYVDDVAYPVPVMTQGLLFDIDQVEVLRGPQGTLYGRNTTGGAIKVVSARPTDEFSVGASLEGGRFGRVDGEAFVSGPISDSIRVRIAGAGSHGGDWQVNRETGAELGGAERYALRGLVEVDFSETITGLFNLHGFTDDSDGLGLQLFNDSTFGPLAHEGRRETSFGSSTDFQTLTGISTTQGPFRDTEGWGASVTLNGAFGAVDAVYIGSFETLNRKEFNDFDALSLGGAGVFFQSSVDVFSHELRFSGGEGTRLRWVAGGYYSDEDLNEVYQSDFAASFGPGFAVTTPYNQDVRTLAAFAHVDFDITDAITLVGGLRYEDENRDLNDLGTFSLGTGLLNFANGTIDGTLESRTLDSDDISATAGVNFKPADNILLYASYSRGVKSGGFTAYNTLNAEALTPFQPEKLNAYEVGFKTDFADNRVRLNAAAFYYDYKDQQVQSAIFVPDIGGGDMGAVVGRIVNADSEIYGAEAELTVEPAPWIAIGQSLAYKTGEFTDFVDLDVAATGAAGPAVFVDRSGQSLGIPEISYQGFVRTEHQLANSYVFSTSFNYAYRDRTTPPLLGATYSVDDYWLANAEIAIAPSDGLWELAFWGRNIFNTDYDETRNFFITPSPAADVAAPGLPVTYGARISVRY